MVFALWNSSLLISKTGITAITPNSKSCRRAKGDHSEGLARCQHLITLIGTNSFPVPAQTQARTGCLPPGSPHANPTCSSPTLDAVPTLGQSHGAPDSVQVTWGLQPSSEVRGSAEKLWVGLPDKIQDTHLNLNFR